MEEKELKLKEIAQQLRLDVVQMIGSGKTGHLGGSCSIADIMAALYFYKMALKHPVHSDYSKKAWDDLHALEEGRKIYIEE